jgi:transcriptional antiterminator RfaH
MPILAKEVDLFPENLLDVVCEDRSPDAGWWAMYTIARREKDLMRRLLAARVPFYGPLIERTRRSAGGRVRRSQAPLFPSYVFLFGTADDRYHALTTNCVSRDIRVDDPAGLTRDLRQIRQFAALGYPLTPESRLEPGVPVRIRSGLLQGREGVVIRRHGKARLLLAVNFLQQGASVDVADFDVEKIG